LRDMDKRQGYRGVLKHLPPEEIESFSMKLQEELERAPLEKGKVTKGVVIAVDDKNKKAAVRMGAAQGVLTLKDMKWARTPNPEVAYYAAKVRRVGSVLRVGDVIDVHVKGKVEEKDKKEKDRGLWSLALEQTPAAQSALMSMETETGHVKVMVGGRDFKTSQFNRATQSRRQPGSAFKPILYAAALDKGYTAATVIYDTAEVHKDLERDFKWKPKNYKQKFFGPTLFREALVKSRNVVTVKILKDIGIHYAIQYARNLGITSELSQDLSISLGSSGISLLEILTAYSVFANQGYLVQPVFITKIVDRDGNVLEEAKPAREKVIEKSTAYIITNIMESVVKSGTGHRVRALKRPAAGKTGTSNTLFDAWFVGYTPRYVTGVWVGFDDERSLGKGETGSRAASPIWLAFMQKVLNDKPVLVFNVPEGVEFAKIDAETGKLPIKESKKTIFECFKEGSAPTEYTKRPDVLTEPEDLFMEEM
ncbi:MAG: S1 RNA-binding domain-containing protein, partial [Desulfobacterales bacterium]|nr:S1 RNA-binding domain-containing protein [Desulfobacterales bacterium]